MNLEECYSTLDLSPGASIEEIERAYRQLVRVWHPDRFPQDVELREKANQKLKKINEAYATLKSGGGEQDGTEGKNFNEFPYRDWECRYFGEDPRLKPLSRFELNGVPAAVEIASEGVTLVTFRNGELDDAVRYPRTTVQLLIHKCDRWCAQGVPSKSLGTDFFPENETILNLADPEGIKLRGFIVRLRFRNDYFASVFAKRIRTAYRLVKPQKPKTEPIPANPATTSDDQFATGCLIVLSFIVVVGVTLVIFLAANPPH